MNIQFNRYMVLVAGVYLMTVSGSGYLFASYSNELQNRFNYNAVQISLVGTLGNVGGWVGLFGGLFYDRFGPLATTIVATIMIFLGYFFIYLAFVGSFFTNYLAIGFCLLIMGQGSSWAYTVALATNCKNFDSKDRGMIVGVLVCFFGLCGGIYTEFYRGFFHNAEPFLLFMAVTFSSVVLVFGCMSKVITKKEDTEYFRIRIAYGLGITVAIYLAFANFLSAFLTIDNHSSIYFPIPLIFILSWFLAIGIFHVDKIVTCYPEEKGLSNLEDGLNMSPEDVQPLENNMTLLQVMLKVEYWIIFIAFLCTIGSGITTVNNLSNIVISRSGLPIDPVPHLTKDKIPHYSEINALVILFSVFNTLGRMGMGVAADKLRERISREIMFVIASLLMTAVQIYMAFSTVGMMYAGIVVLGISYGGLFCIVPIIVSERFGLQNFGANWGLMGCAPAIGALSIATYLAGGLAEKFLPQGQICIIEGSQTTCQCLGNDCYQYTYIFTTGACVVATILGILVRCFWPHKMQYYAKIGNQ